MRLNSCGLQCSICFFLCVAICGACSDGGVGDEDAGTDAGIDAGEPAEDGEGDAATDAGGDQAADAGGDRVGDPGGDEGPVVLRYDVVVVGAGTGGVAASIQAARLGVRVALLEETDWIGGQMTAAAVSTLDEGGFNDDSGIYIEFVRRMIDHYAALGKDAEVCGIRGNWRGTEARVGRQILRDMLAAESGIDLYERTRVTRMLSVGGDPHPVVTGVEAVRTTGGGVEDLRLESAVVVDATEYGDLLPLSPARYRVGNTTSDAVDVNLCVQDITYTCVIRRYPGGAPAELRITSPPPGYTQAVEDHFASIVAAGGNDWRQTPWGTYPVNWLTHVAYRSVPDSTNPETFGPEEYEKMSRTGVNWANDFDYTVGALQDREVRRTVHCRAKLHTIMFLYYLQEILGENDWAIADDEGFDTPYTLEENLCDNIPQDLKPVERHFPVIPYVRESRRMIGVVTLTAGDIKREGSPPRGARRFESSLAVGDYPVDLHDCNQDTELEQELESRGDIPQANRSGPFQIPFAVFIPEATDGLLAAEKNLSYSRLASGACRLHPITMHTGQAVGVLAALSKRRGVQPRRLDPVPVQWELLQANARLGVVKFTDVPLGHEYWRDVELATVHGVFAGYPDGTFGVFDPLTRAQAAVVLARLFELPTSNPPPDPTFEDVQADHWAYAQIEAVEDAGITSGCSASPPLFCPDDPATRGQMATFVIRGLGLDPQTASTDPHYVDMPSSHPLFGFIQLAADLGLVEACAVSPNHYCPDDSSLRGETARISARTLLHLHP